MFVKLGARRFLREKFGEDAEAFSACLGDEDILKQLKHILWQELVQPCAAEYAQLVGHSWKVKVERQQSVVKYSTQ